MLNVNLGNQFGPSDLVHAEELQVQINQSSSVLLNMCIVKIILILNGFTNIRFK
jgi:hypothetical protein